MKLSGIENRQLHHSQIKYKTMKIHTLKNKWLVALLSFWTVFGSLACSGDSGEPTPPEENKNLVKIATFNVRYNNANDAGNLWVDRRNLVSEILRIYEFDIFGAQEPYYDQLSDMIRLSPEYAYVGLSRTGLENSGEFAPIFYRKDKVEILDHGQFWLTEKDRNQPNTGWDASAPRICTWAKVRHKTIDKTFFVFNTHLDHIGVQAREESTKLLLEVIPDFAGELPFLLLGDFNYDQNSGNYQLLKNSPVLTDTYDIAQQKVNANRGTLNSFNPNSTSTARIDHIFINRQNSPTVVKHQIITNSFQGKVPSDHFPVMVELRFE